ncbi:MAG: hypothetical protein KDF63_00890 [Rhodoferax sp.]|nr:hypothetical protein [Rhodoferax sp.]
MAIGDGIGPAGDWTSAVEQAVTAEFIRRRRVARGTLALLALVAALVLAALAWRLHRVGAEAERSAELAAERAAERTGAAQVAPLAARDDELFANQVALARHQVDLAERLERLEKEAVALAVTLDRLGLLDADAAGLPAQVLPPAIRTLPSTQSRQQARIAALEQRVRALERLGAETGEAAAGAQRP